MSNYYLYEHKQDHSVLIIARVLDSSTGEYECRRYGDDPTNTFVIPAEAFLNIYQRRKSGRV